MAAYRYSSFVLSLFNTDVTLAAGTNPTAELNDLEDAGLLIAEISAWPLFIRHHGCIAAVECCSNDRYPDYRSANRAFLYSHPCSSGRIRCQATFTALSFASFRGFWSEFCHIVSTQWSCIHSRAICASDARHERYGMAFGRGAGAGGPGASASRAG